MTEVNVCGTGVSIDSLDADATIRELVGRGVPFRDLEIIGAGLEQAFVALTGCGSASANAADRPRVGSICQHLGWKQAMTDLSIAPPSLRITGAGVVQQTPCRTTLGATA